MMWLWAAVSAVLSAPATAAESGLDITIGGVTVARTVITPYDDSSKESREATYKIFTHVMDFDGKEPITKGAGGLYTHHRGMFIGWRKTTVGGKTFDTWHMTDCYQVFDREFEVVNPDAPRVNRQAIRIFWRGNDGTHILNEDRLIAAWIEDDGSRVFDFFSALTAGDEDIMFRGDSHHAGMQIRLSNEVSEHPDTTKYLIQPGGELLKNDEGSGTWWVVCAADIGGKRYWVMHMTPPNHPGGQPLYSIRPYARFGAFSEHDLKAGQSLVVLFRIVVSETEIAPERAAELYAAFADDAL
jgi:hypothetical protein